jgi:hypothetical protein
MHQPKARQPAARFAIEVANGQEAGVVELAQRGQFPVVKMKGRSRLSGFMR